MKLTVSVSDIDALWQVQPLVLHDRITGPNNEVVLNTEMPIRSVLNPTFVCVTLIENNDSCFCGSLLSKQCKLIYHVSSTKVYEQLMTRMHNRTTGTL